MDVAGDASRQSKTNQELQFELLEQLNLREREWIMAAEENRDFARQRFMNALYIFQSLVLYGKLSPSSPRVSL